MTPNDSYNSTLAALKSQLTKANTVSIALRKVCLLINQNLEHYNWVGFYFMNHTTKKLHLGPYVGAATDHTIIDFGKGICGQVAISGDTFISADVNAESNYIACSIDVKSEIVVPMYKAEKLIGQIDIDSHKKDRFGAEDEAFLKQVNELIVASLPNLEKEIASLF